MTPTDRALQPFEKPADTVSVDELASREAPPAAPTTDEPFEPVMSHAEAEQADVERSRQAGPRRRYSADDLDRTPYVPIERAESVTWRAPISLQRTIRVGISADPEWGAVGTPKGIEYGIDVPHEGANVQCNAIIGEQKDFESGITHPIRCKKRAGHEPGPLQHPDHEPRDIRVVASSRRGAKGFRFAPSGLPAGVDQSITSPHNCENHLKDVEEVERGYR